MTHTTPPWFAPPPPVQTQATSGHCAIIGGGLAGCWAAYTLSQQGWRTTLLDKCGIASQASGNPQGVLQPNPTHGHFPPGDFATQAFLRTLRHLHQLSVEEPSLIQDLRGVFRPAFSPKMEALQQRLVQQDKWPDLQMMWLSPEQTAEYTGLPSEQGGLFFPQAGTLSPVQLCKTLLHIAGTELLVPCTVKRLVHNGSGWTLLDTSGKSIIDSDIVILANGLDALDFSECASLPLRSVRGQLTYLPSSQKSQNQHCTIAGQVYITPARAGYHILGATFHNDDPNPVIDPKHHEENAQGLQKTHPGLARMLLETTVDSESPDLEKNSYVGKLQGRVAFRCVAENRLPMVGALPNFDMYLERYQDLLKGHRTKNYPEARYHPGLYISLGHGSRGITSACLAAEHIAAQLTGQPSPLEESGSQAVHPARYLMRHLLKRRLPPFWLSEPSPR